jgi:Sap, sulfolipid-1-addressing protein
LRADRGEYWAMSLSVLPLAVTMVIGPGLLAAIVLVTAEHAVPTSVAYVLGFGTMVTIGVIVMRGIASLLGSSVDLGDSSDSGSTGTIIQIALIALLVLASAKQYLGRATAKPPKWLGILQSATPAKAYRMGLVVVAVMPSDLVIMFTVGVNLEQNGSSVLDALPFIALTTVIAGLPLLARLLFHSWADRAMPGVRDWMNANSWLVNIIVFGIFILLIL